MLITGSFSSSGNYNSEELSNMKKILFQVLLVHLVIFHSFASETSFLLAKGKEDVIIEMPSLTIEGEEDTELEHLMNSFEEKEKSSQDRDTQDADNTSLTSSFSRTPHQARGGISYIEKAYGSNDFFYVGGEDGFVSKVFHPSLKMQTWQVSRLGIKKIAAHPNPAFVAFYESDGSSVHKISSWNWQLKERKFIIRPNYPVTYMAWSANGNYLLVGNTENGIEIFNNRGETVEIYSKKPGIVLLATTGKREKSIVSYSKNGKITYTSVQGKNKLAECKSEEELQEPCIFQNFTRIAGYKNGKVIVVNAYKGEKLEEYDANGEVIFTTNADSDKPIWLSKHKKKNNYTLHIASENSASFSLPSSKAIRASIYLSSLLIAGDEDGKLYVLENKKGKVALHHQWEYQNESIQEIASDGTTLFMLKNGNLIAKKAMGASDEVLKGKLDCSSIVCDGKNVILWNCNERKPIYKYDVEKQKISTIYKPKTALLSLSLYKGNIVTVEASGLISLLNLKSGKVVFSQNIEGAESALQREDEHIIVAKNALGNSASPLFELNIKTKESVPIRLAGELAYFLCRSKELSNTFFCFLFDSTKADSKGSLTSKTTNLIQFSTENNKALTAKFENLLSYADEDFSPFIESCKGGIITNLGKDALIHFNLYSKKITHLPRSFALPKKAVLLGDSIVSLGLDGSLNWHNFNNLNE